MGNQEERDRSRLPKCSPQPRTPTEIHRIGLRREGGEEIEVTWGRKRRVKRGESNQASNHTPEQKCVLKIGFLKVQN